MTYGDLEEVGRVEKATIGFEDHGILTFSLVFDFGGSGQGFCGYDLRHPKGYKIIEGILNAFGVSDWDQIVGKIITVERDEQNYIKALKPFPFQKGAKRFDIREWSEEVRKDNDNE